MKQKIGIWGFGVVGKSVLNYYINQKNQFLIQVMDKQVLSAEQLDFFKKNNIKFITQDQVDFFFQDNDIIIASPGINIKPYEKYLYKILTEIDIFSQKWEKTTMAFTGSVGKTSIVHIFSNILKFFDKKSALGGNIGLGMLNLLEDQNIYDSVILELSSFQLQFSKKCAPDIAVWTNFYPNHLDRHENLEEYFKAKAQIFINQTPNQQTLLPWELIPYIEKYLPQYKFSQQLAFFSTDSNCLKSIQSLEDKYLNNNLVFYLINKNNEIIKYKNQKQIALISIDQLPSISYKTNWLILIALCDLLNLDIKKLKDIKFDIPSHRLELVKTINNINFYNDSKATIAESTLEAIKHLAGKPIHLFLGGTSKGISRELLIKNLKNKVKIIYCFGKEAKDLVKFCNQENIAAFEFDTLQPAVEFCFRQAKPGDQILFSPAGASYDLFKDYQDRGNAFKEIVNKLIASK